MAMAELETRTVALTRRPGDCITADDFSIVNSRLVPLPQGVVTRTLFISLDPYLALNISHGETAGEPLPRILQSRTIGLVEASESAKFLPGDCVLGFGAWADIDVRVASALHKLDLALGAPEKHLASLGHSGFTAWLGLRQGKATAGETILVSGAAGAVGSVAGVLARRMGCRVVGIAGGEQKGKWLTDELGFHAVVDYRKANYHQALAEAAPDGYDLLFENVGINSLDPALPLMKPGGRIALCGLVAHYQDDAPLTLANFRQLLMRSITVIPFSIYDHDTLRGKAIQDLAAAEKAGELPARFTISDGLEALPDAFVAMLHGRGMGKHLVRLEQA